MPTSITVTSVSGTPPYEIYVCDSFGAHCEYVANTSTLPITIFLSPTFDYAPIVLVKTIDSLGCEVFKQIICDLVPTVTPGPTLTPTQTLPPPLSPTPTYVSGCTIYTLQPPVDTVFTFTNCVGDCESLLVYSGGQMSRCVQRPYFAQYATDTGVSCEPTPTPTPNPTSTPLPTNTPTASSIPSPTATPPLVTLTPTPTSIYTGSYFALKVNDATLYLGNDVTEDAHINYAVCMGFNSFQMYGLRKVMPSTDPLTGATRLATFVDKLYAAGLNPVAIRSSASGFDEVYNWEQTYGRQFWGISKENEFWNYPASGTETFATWINSMNYIRTTYPHWHRSAYLANPTNAWGAPEAAQIIAAQIDVIEVTNYNSGAPNPSSSNFLTKNLQLLANAAAAASVVQDFVPLWSSEGPPDNNFSGPYFSLTPPNLSVPYTTYQSQYNALSFPNKTSVNKIGFSLFAYDDLVIWLPQCL